MTLAQRRERIGLRLSQLREMEQAGVPTDEAEFRRVRQLYVEVRREMAERGDDASA